MTRNVPFWLALLAAILAGSALVLRLIRGAGDWFELIGPAGIILLMISIMARNRPGGSEGANV